MSQDILHRLSKYFVYKKEGVNGTVSGVVDTQKLITNSDLYNLRRDAGRDWCGAGGHTFVRTADAAVRKSAKNAL